MKVTIKAHNYHCHIEGPTTAPAVVLSHSLATNFNMWAPQVGALSPGYRIVRYDTLGHGGTDAPPGPYSLGRLTDDTLALLDALEIERAHFVGLSMGGMIGQALALKAPERLTSLVLCDTTSRIPPEARPVYDERIRTAETQGMEPLVEPTLARWFTPSFRARRTDMVANIGAMIRATPPAGYVGCSHAIAALNLTDQIKAIRLPTLILVGADDPGTPVADSRVIHEQISGSKLEVILSAAHLSNIEQAAEFNRLLTGFLRSFD